MSRCGQILFFCYMHPVCLAPFPGVSQPFYKFIGMSFDLPLYCAGTSGAAAPPDSLWVFFSSSEELFRGCFLQFARLWALSLDWDELFQSRIFVYGLSWKMNLSFFFLFDDWKVAGGHHCIR